MSDLVLVDGDALLFEPMFGNRQVIVPAGAVIRGSGQATVGGRPICILGDEGKLQLQAQYLIPGYSPGQGLVSIVQLSPAQQAPRCVSGAPILLGTDSFAARFTPTVPALMSSPPNSPDVPAPSMGRGRFVPRQMLVRAG